MSEAKFNPGPWEINKEVGSKYVFWVEQEEVSVAKCFKESDALLIAAAPEMYEAIEELCKYLSFPRPLRSDMSYCFINPENLEKALDKARKALTKAKGGD